MVEIVTNLDSIFKSRDITLPTKVRLVKAMVFPVVMYGCAHGSSQWSVLCTTTKSAGARPGLGTYVAASRRAGCRQIPGQPCGLPSGVFAVPNYPAVV